MLYLAFIWHMHQPYYKDLIKDEFLLPWVRLHGIKDYLDMVEILRDFPKIKANFNLVPSLIEQFEDYSCGNFKDRFWQLTQKRAEELSEEDKDFLLNNFFLANEKRMISIHPRYYELYLKKKHKERFSEQDFLDLQVWFNLAWFDPLFLRIGEGLKSLVNKGRFFSEEDKAIILDKQIEIIKGIIPAYRQFQDSRQIEISISPYYHPILPLIYNTEIAKEAGAALELPRVKYKYPQDVQWHIEEAIKFYERYFQNKPQGLWPSEEAVSEDILDIIIQTGISWLVTDEAILFKSEGAQKEHTALYQPYRLERKKGNLNILFRDAELSNKIGFLYHRYKTKEAIDDFFAHLDKINRELKGKSGLVSIALDGENPWEHYRNDGWDFLSSLYERLTKESQIETVRVSDYLKRFPAQMNLPRLSCGSWINGDFSQWIGDPVKNLAWEYLAKAREELNNGMKQYANPKIYQQMYILEGSDWFWWYGEGHEEFDLIFRRHLSNFYNLIAKPSPEYLKRPLSEQINPHTSWAKT